MEHASCSTHPRHEEVVSIVFLLKQVARFWPNHSLAAKLSQTAFHHIAPHHIESRHTQQPNVPADLYQLTTPQLKTRETSLFGKQLPPPGMNKLLFDCIAFLRYWNWP